MLFTNPTDIADLSVQQVNQELQLGKIIPGYHGINHITVHVRMEDMKIEPMDVMVVELCDNQRFELLYGLSLSRVFSSRDDLGRFCFISSFYANIMCTNEVTMKELVKAKAELGNEWVNLNIPASFPDLALA